MKIDFDELYREFSETEKRDFEADLIERLRSVLASFSKKGLYYKEQSAKIVAAEPSSPSDEKALDETELTALREIIDNNYMYRYCTEQRLDILKVLLAMIWPRGDPPEHWDVEAIEQVLADRSEREKFAASHDEMARDAQGSASEPPKNGKPHHRGTAPGLLEAVDRAVQELGWPGTNGSAWKPFYHQVWQAVGVEPNAPLYSDRTIRRVVASLAKSRNAPGRSGI
jgi:hypothetical protein